MLFTDKEADLQYSCRNHSNNEHSRTNITTNGLCLSDDNFHVKRTQIYHL